MDFKSSVYSCLDLPCSQEAGLEKQNKKKSKIDLTSFSINS